MADIQQSHIWEDERERLAFAELVNTFYVREIEQLSQSNLELPKLKRVLKSLPYYIERVALRILQGETPLQLDSQNASWLSPQKKLILPSTSINEAYFSNQAVLGLVVPVLITNFEQRYLVLDCIDQINELGVHTNYHGWFNYNGQAKQPHVNKVICKPMKSLMVSASCGHRWHFNKNATPRTLSLREMLLASMINWKNVRNTKH